MEQPLLHCITAALMFGLIVWTASDELIRGVLLATAALIAGLAWRADGSVDSLLIFAAMAWMAGASVWVSARRWARERAR